MSLNIWEKGISDIISRLKSHVKLVSYALIYRRHYCEISSLRADVHWTKMRSIYYPSLAHAGREGSSVKTIMGIPFMSSCFRKK